MAEVVTIFKGDNIDFGSDTYREFIRFFMYDSIMLPHPYAEVIYEDKAGQFFYTYGMIENTNVQLGMGNDSIGFLKHDFYFRDFNMGIPNSLVHVTGNLNMFFKSTFKKQDSVKSRSFNGNISDIVDEIANEYTYPTQTKSDFIKISDTDNEDFWYQSEMNDMDFMQMLCKSALSVNNEDAPFFCFWNLNSEFRFMDAQELLLQEQGDIPVLEFTDGPNTSIQTGNVLTYGYTQQGSFKNMPNYNRRFYSVEPNASETLEELDFSKIHLPTAETSNEKMLVRTNDIENVRTTKYYGLINDINENNYAGWVNQQYIDSCFPVRFDIGTALDVRLVAGSLVDLIVYTPDRQIISKEYSGRYLILESRHLIDEAGTPRTMLVVGKNGTKVSKDNLYFNDLVSK